MIENYKTQDFYLAAFLLAKGHELESCIKKEGEPTTFIFHDSAEIQDLVKKFYDLEASINPMTFGHSLRNLKSIVHNAIYTKPKNYYVKQSGIPQI